MFELTQKCFIIAEAGTCHDSPAIGQRLIKAKQYVLAAHNAGADCIKFQIFDCSGPLFCPYPGDAQRWPRWWSSELEDDDWRQIKEITEGCGMMFLASVFQHSTVEMLHELGVEATKVASRAAEKFPYDKATGKLLVSLGMGYPDSLVRLVSDGKAYCLECEAHYPSTRQWSNQTTGFSDHSGTPWRAIDAISRGCKLIEVHFYIDPLDAGPDLPASLNLDQLKLVCEARDAFAELRSNE